MLADMATEIDAARLLVHRAAWLSKNGEYRNAEGSMSKLKAGRVAVWVTERAIQILGGYGYVREYPVERWHRDAKIYDIFEGTEQIQQLVIARAIIGSAHRVARLRSVRLRPMGGSWRDTPCGRQSLRRAWTWRPPATTFSQAVSSPIWTGLVRRVVVPSPSWP